MSAKDGYGDIETQAELNDLVGRSPLYLGLFDLDGRLQVCSPSWRQLIPMTPQNQQRLSASLAHDRALVSRSAGGTTETTPAIWIQADDGTERCVIMRFGPWRDKAGRITALMGQCWDVTDTEAHRLKLERTEQRLQAALSMDRMVVMEADLKTGEVTISGSSQEMLDLMKGSGPAMENVHPDDRDRVHREGHLATPEGTTHPIEYRHNGDKLIWLSCLARTMTDEGGEPVSVVIVTQDVTEKVLRRQEVERLAYSDSLTGLPNRARFQADFDAAVRAAETQGSAMGLIMVDVDHFKQINDTLGHDAGDALLKALADEMRRSFRATDTVARLGGDEFAILLQDVNSEADLIRPLDALRAVLAKPIFHRGQGFRISTSIGVALHNDPEADPEHLLKNADIALYQAKTSGRDRVVLFQPSMRSEVEQRLELFRDVRAAIPRGEFVLFYQPVVNTTDGVVEGFEALMRWNHPDQGVLTPAHFQGAFDDQDLSLQLGEVAINGALKQMRAWMDQGVAFGSVSINLSAAQFRTGSLARDILARLEHWKVPPERLTVEVTENVSMGWGADVVGDTVRALHEKGVRIALDDFGTGFASLANLRQFPIDRLKIDKSFVQNSDDDAIVRAVINLGASMGMQVVAEGVEQLQQLQALTRYGCDHIQGYHFARPMPAEAVPAYIAGFSARPIVIHAA